MAAWIPQVRCNTFLTGCRLSWPPPCRLHSPSPFCSCCVIWSLSVLLGSFPLASPAYQKRPPRAFVDRLLLRRAKKLGEFAVRSLWPVLYITSHSTHRWACTHFGRNQPPDCSIGLSPLYPTYVNELHINTTYHLQLTFASLRSCQV